MTLSAEQIEALDALEKKACIRGCEAEGDDVCITFLDQFGNPYTERLRQMYPPIAAFLLAYINAYPALCGLALAGLRCGEEHAGNVAVAQSGEAPGTTSTPERPTEWTCFHCWETFTDVDAARSHFGATPEAMTRPRCIPRAARIEAAERKSAEQQERIKQLEGLLRANS